MASGKKNYFRHSFNARNDEFIVGLMNEFKEKGYYMWFALCEMSGEMLADGHQWPLKFNQSRLYKELRCNHSKLHMFFTYVEHRCKISVTYVEPTFSLEIPSLSKYIGKYSEISPNKRKEKEIKENKTLSSEEGEKNLSEISPLNFRNPKLTPDDLIQTFNDLLAGNGKIVHCRGLSGKDIQEFITTTAYREFTKIETWKEIFEKVSSSEFLTGKSGSSFVATLNWLVRHENALKVLNGQYGGGKDENDVKGLFDGISEGA